MYKQFKISPTNLSGFPSPIEGLIDELDGPAVSVPGVRSRNLGNVRNGQSLDG
jgi:hypothetical protein